VNLKILKKTEDEVQIEFEDENHSLLNLLKTVLLDDDRVQFTTYDTKFPTMTNPVFRLKTNGSDPVELLADAAAKIVELCKEFDVQFEAALR